MKKATQTSKAKKQGNSRESVDKSQNHESQLISKFDSQQVELESVDNHKTSAQILKYKHNSKIQKQHNRQSHIFDNSDSDSSNQFQDELDDQSIDNDQYADLDDQRRQFPKSDQQDVQDDQYDQDKQDDQDDQDDQEESKIINQSKQKKQVKQRENIKNVNKVRNNGDQLQDKNETQTQDKNETQTQDRKKSSKKQTKQPKSSKTTKQIKQTASSQKRKMDDSVRELINNQFLFDIDVTLVYQSDDLLTYLVENSGDDFINKLIIDHFRSLYDNICYKGIYIKRCQQLIERSLINCILVRNGKMIYEVNSIVQIQHIKIDPFSILNTQVMEINQSHNSQFVLLINKGTEDSNLNVANVFIQLENVSQEAQQIYNQSMQIGQYIPCVAQKIIYHSGQQHITIFASILKKLNFKHIYAFKTNSPINLEILKDQIHKVNSAQQEINEEGIIKIKQYIELLLNSQLDEKQLQNRLNAQFDVKSLHDHLDSNTTIFVEMDLINYIYGSISIINQQQLQQYQEQQIIVNIVEDQHNQILFSQLINRIIKWQLFFIEFVSLNSSVKSFKNLQSILSI